MNTVPGGGSQSRASRSPRVDLPLPVGPTTATVSPGATSKLTSRSAGARSVYVNVRCENRMPGVVVATWAVAGSLRPLDASTISRMRPIEVRPRRTVDRVQPSARVGHVRYAR